MISPTLSPIRTGPAAHVFTVSLHPGPSARDRQRYFRKMQRDLIRCGLIVNYCACDTGPTLCVAVKEHDARWRTDRHLYVRWLIDQPQTCHVSLLPAPPLQQLIEDERGLLSKLIHIDQPEGQVGHWPLARVVGGLVTRTLYRLRAK